MEVDLNTGHRKNGIHDQLIIFTTRCICISAVYAGTRCLSICPSVCLSVCPSVTFVSCAKTNKDIFKLFSPCGTQDILVFPYQTGWRYSNGNPLTGASNATGGMKKIDDFRPISRCNSETVIVRWAHAWCTEKICKHRILFPSIQHLT